MAAFSMKYYPASSCVLFLRTSPDDVDTGGPRNVSLLDIQLRDAAASPRILLLFRRHNSLKLDIKTFNLLHVPTVINDRVSRYIQNISNMFIIYLILNSFTQPVDGIT
jgi:hypothetical protein